MEQITISTKVGYSIIGHEFSPDNSSKGIVIISPATGVKQGYYSKFAEFLASKGLVVLTFDFGGIGKSKPLPLNQFDTSAFNWGNNDLEAVLLWAKQKYPDLPTTIIGHSIGGQMIGLAPSAHKAQKIILVGSQTGYWKFWQGSERIKMLVNWYFFIPFMCQIFGYLPSKRVTAMEDLPKTMALEWTKWCKTPNYLFEYFQEEELYFKKVTAPIYSYSISDDKFASKEAVDWLSSKYSNAQLTRKHFQPKDVGFEKFGHFGFFKSMAETTFWQMFLEDIEEN